MADQQGLSLTRDELRRVLGPVADPGPLHSQVHDEVACDGYFRRRVSYAVPAGRASAFVCVPDRLSGPAPLVFCHHQHAGQFDLGKSEVCGLRGDPNQAYAAELAQRGFVTIAPDAIGFEDRNWADGQNIGWFELSSRLVQGRTLLADCLQEISLAIDYASTLPEVDPTRVGFIGHSYGGRAAIWAPAWDERITVSVSTAAASRTESHSAGMLVFRPSLSYPVSQRTTTSRTFLGSPNSVGSCSLLRRPTGGVGVPTKLRGVWVPPPPGVSERSTWPVGISSCRSIDVLPTSS